MENNTNLVPLQDVERMGQLAAASGYLGTRSQAEAITLMLVAQSEGRHPMSVAKEYHIINGKPSLRADAMLARFQTSGGSVRWKEMGDTRVVGVFTHPKGGEVTIDWDIERAKKACLGPALDKYGNPNNWMKFPRQMLRARCISEGVRAVYPAVISGFLTPEEIEDFAPEQKKSAETEVHAAPAPAPAPAPADAVDVTPVSPAPAPSPAPAQNADGVETSVEQDLRIVADQLEADFEAGVPYADIRARVVEQFGEKPPLVIRAMLSALRTKSLSHPAPETEKEANNG